MRKFEPLNSEHGAHTLREQEGVIVGIDVTDVFVELGPRMQGVIDRRAFADEPALGDVHTFTLGGQEEGLWALSLTVEPVLSTWENLEVGSLIEAKVVRTKPGGLEVKIGALHAFLPKSQTGLERSEDPATLVGKQLVCEVTEIDFERQRCSVSRRLVVQRGRTNERQREIGTLAPGTIVQGRVSRIEGYGVFVRFGHGLEGLIHISNLAWERVSDPTELFKTGDSIEAKVLYIKRAGKRIGLGLKQISESPWCALERERAVGELIMGKVTRITDFGLFLQISGGAEGLIHRSETGIGPEEPLQHLGAIGSVLTARILDIDAEEERLSLSLLYETGRRIAPEAMEAQTAFRELAENLGEGPQTHLGELLRRALGEESA